MNKRETSRSACTQYTVQRCNIAHTLPNMRRVNNQRNACSDSTLPTDRLAYDTHNVYTVTFALRWVASPGRRAHSLLIRTSTRSTHTHIRIGAHALPIHYTILGLTQADIVMITASSSDTRGTYALKQHYQITWKLQISQFVKFNASILLAPNPSAMFERGSIFSLQFEG